MCWKILSCVWSASYSRWTNEPLLCWGEVIDFTVDDNSWDEGVRVRWRADVTSIVGGIALPWAGSSLKSSWEVIIMSLKSPKTSSPSCPTWFPPSAPLSALFLVWERGSSSSSIMGASAGFSEGPVSSLGVEHFTSQVSAEISPRMCSLVEIGRSGVFTGESGTSVGASWGWVKREGWRSLYWCKNSSFSRNFMLLSSTGTAFNLSKICLRLGSLAGGGSAKTGKEWN